MSARDGEGFLNRWSARKRAGGAGPSPEAIEAQEADTRPAAPEPERPDAEILAELDLPEPDSLGPGDDFRRFLSDDVPSRLKTRALRRLWLTNPVLANLDELVDYGDDFTDAAKVVENLKTAYRAGRGFLRDETPGIDGEAEIGTGTAADTEAMAEASERDASVPGEHAHKPGADAERRGAGSAAPPESARNPIPSGEIDAPGRAPVGGGATSPAERAAQADHIATLPRHMRFRVERG